MARIVAAMAMTHSPGLTGWFEAAPEEQQKLALGALGEMRRRLEAARPDVLLMFSNDHLLNWPINNTPEFTVGSSTRVPPTGTTSGSPSPSTGSRGTPPSGAISSPRAPDAGSPSPTSGACSSTTGSRFRPTT